jgi:probable rRNA maturation factor
MIGEGVADAELSLSLVTDEEMAELHERYLGLPGPTDVLSFPLDEDDRDEDGVRLLGDVVVAPSVAARDAPEDPAAELRLLVVHGILHLLGHDHLRDEDRARMWARQQRYTGVRIP